MISVCIASFNGEKYIGEQIASILKQLSPEDEIIISDDNSFDRTCDIVKSFNDKRIKLKYNNNPKQHKRCNAFYKISSNFENALKQAKGNIIFLSDQDDIWDDSKVEKYLKLLNKYDFVKGNYQYIDGRGNFMNKVRFSSFPLKGLLYNLLMFPFHGASIAFNRKVLDCILPFPKGTIQHDVYIGKVALLNFKCIYYEEALTFYRLHNKNSSNHGEKSKNPLWFKVYIRLFPLFWAIIRFINFKINKE